MKILSKKKGFTLIELLVVIAIIGILATIVIVNVNSARTKAQDVAIKGSLDNLRPGAELYYDGNSNSYSGFCQSADAAKASVAINNIQSGFQCVTVTATSYVASAQMKSSATSFWCVDSSGNSKAETSAIGSSTTACS